MGPVDLTKIEIKLEKRSWMWENALHERDGLNKGGEKHRLDWVIIGGESGPGARPMELRWVHDIVSQCQAAKIPVFVKQIGSRPVVGGQTYTYYDGGPVDVERRDRKGGNPAEWPAGIGARIPPRSAPDMVAYSFKARFAEPIIAGTKGGTIRAAWKMFDAGAVRRDGKTFLRHPRRDTGGHARPGEELQLYTGMRTKHCRLIARKTCVAVQPIRLNFAHEVVTLADHLLTTPATLDPFALFDGFASWYGSLLSGTAHMVAT